VVHRTVEELWFVVSGRGEMWRREADHSEVVEMEPGVCLTIPVGVHFQFRTHDQPLAVVGVTMPPWPGDGEAIVVEGAWAPSVSD
jgi:mannose-6-phosphate isomerase-like protein (cupin superfamily)